jgi:hypothetical protein
VASRLDRRPPRSARRWRPRRAPVRQPVVEEGQELLRTGLIIAATLLAVFVLFPLLIGLAGMPYR